MDETTAIGVGVTALVVLVILSAATRSARDPREPGRWARAHGVAITSANAPLVAYFVPLVAVMRVVGGIGGLVLGPLFDRAVGARTSVGLGFWVWIVAGWMLGAWLADRHVGADLRTGRGASLAARRLADYLPLGLRGAPAIGAAGVVVLAATLPGGGPSTIDRVTSAVVAVATAGLVALGQRSVVGRPQPADEPSVLAADDAVRATTIHHVGGGGTAVTLFLIADLAGEALAVGSSGTGPGLLFLIAGFGALVAWRYFAFRAWRVRRPAIAAPRLVGAGP